MSISNYQHQCRRAVAERTAAIPGMPRRWQLQAHAANLAQSYGCTESPRWAAMLRKDGSPRAGAIDHAPRPHFTHRITAKTGHLLVEINRITAPREAELRVKCYRAPQQWQADVQRTAAKRLNLEINGCKRALWLAMLWMGADVSSLRESYYHADEFPSRNEWAARRHPVPGYTNYWAWAWKLSQDGCSLDRMIQYMRGLLWAWSSRTGGTHSGEHMLRAIEDLIADMSGERAA